MGNSRFSKYAWGVLLYNLAAVAWGVYVRAAKYGDGCGSHWPLCDGDSTPLMGPVARIVESSHRIMTSLDGVLVFILLLWSFQAFGKGHLVRKAAVASMAMTIVEGLLGAALVKYRLVVNNDSALRAGFMAGHVVSTFLLMGCIVVTVLAATNVRSTKWRGQASILAIGGIGGAGLVLLAIGGAISALGHQLRPVTDVLQAAMNPNTFWMVRLQPLHPLIAVTVGLYITLAAALISHLRPDPNVRKAARWMVGLYFVQLAIGAWNIWLKAPIGMQMTHLIMADANWISLIATVYYALGEGIERVESRPAPSEVEPSKLKGSDLIKAYVALTKPRVISLLLFTAVASCIAAKGSWPGLGIFLAVMFGGYFAAGSANTINMVIDRDIDLTMKRTATRPTVTQAISSRNALIFAFVLAALSFGLLWGFATLLSAVLALSGLVFYVVVYTLLLKRRTWHNIVIGGAAGAFPPLVGWAAVTDSLPPLALYLFAIVFVWTPVHFWALALLIKDEYAAAGVPMLPVVRGERDTVVQIGLYAIVTTLITLAPLALPNVGWIYGVTAVILNVFLLRYCVQLYRQTERAQASRLFHYSMIYLAVLFLMFAVDRAVVMS